MDERGLPTLITSVRRALRLLETVGERDQPVTAKALARSADLSLATTYHLLRTLVHDGYLAKTDGGYVLGDQVDNLARSGGARSSTEALRTVLRQVHVDFGAATYLAMYVDGEIQLSGIADSAEAPRVDLWVGFDQAAHATALGKSILGLLDEPERLDYLTEHRMADLTPRTVTDRRLLLDTLHSPDRLSVDHEEYTLGTACLAAPVRAGGQLGAIAISVPVRRFESAYERRRTLLHAAERAAIAFAATG